MPMSSHATVLRTEFRFCCTVITFFIARPYQSALSNLCQFHLSLTTALNPQSKSFAPPPPFSSCHLKSSIVVQLSIINHMCLSFSCFWLDRLLGEIQRSYFSLAGAQHTTDLMWKMQPAGLIGPSYRGSASLVLFTCCSSIWRHRSHTRWLIVQVRMSQVVAVIIEMLLK